MRKLRHSRTQKNLFSPAAAGEKVFKKTEQQPHRVWAQETYVVEKVTSP